MPSLPSLSTLYPGLVEPRYATARNLERATYGAHTAAAAAALKQPLFPWQRLVADVMGEVDDDGVLVYRRGIISVQRQAGKTTLDLANDIQNCLMGPNRKIWYTAQSGQHATDKFLEMAEVFEHSPLRKLGKVRRSNGSARISFINGSELRPHPPTADSLHSKQSDKNTIDEGWFFDVVQAKALLGAIVPTTTTRKMLTGQRPQLWLMSTEGTSESGYWNKLLDGFRAGDIPEDTAFFDFGIPLDTAQPDVNDEAALAAFMDVIARWHPGYGYLFEMADLYGFLDELGISEFMRAYGNKRTGAVSRVIPEADWRASSTLDPLPAGAPLCFAAAVGIDGVDTTITVTALDGHRKITEVIDHRPGTGHALERLKELHAKHGAAFAIDGYGPSADLRDRAERAGLPLIDLKTAAVTAACQSVFAGMVPPKNAPENWRRSWFYRPHPALDDAAELAAKRSVSDGAWLWGRRASVGSISALEAGTLSSWGVDHLPEVAGIQIF